MNLNLSRMLTEDEAKKVYTFLKRDEKIIDVSKELGIQIDEVYGLIEILNYYGYSISIFEEEKDIYVRKIRKQAVKNHKKIKPPMSDCKKTTIGVVSDTHLCSKDQQLHMLNTAYRNFYEHDIQKVLHVGDITDGDCSQKRKEQTYSLFMHGFDEQFSYIVEMYPEVLGITTEFIQGNHDGWHFINGGATLGKYIPLLRKDMKYLGQNVADVDINGVKVRLRHPGDGTSKYKSRNLQNYIDTMESGNKAKILLEGHYHKYAYILYRNIHAYLVPSLCCQSKFMESKNMENKMGFLTINIYTDDNNDIQYLMPHPEFFKEEDVKEDDYKKTKKLVIK